MIDRINFLLKYVLCVFSRRWHLFCHVYEVIFFFLFIFLSEAPHIICTALFFIFISSCYICSTVDAQQFVWLSHAIFTVCFFSVCIILLWYRKDKRFLYCTKKREEKMINTKDMKQICTWRMSHFNFSHPFRTLWNENAFFYVSYKNIHFESWVC